MLSPVEEIKSRIDIVDLIQGYTRLQKAGINYKAICPFHTEKTPSFFVSPSRQIWHCFGGCGEGGDIFKFVMKIEGLDFPEALRMLAGKAGVVLKREDPQIRSERNRLYDICEEAAKIFEKNFSLTPAVKIYLKKRGVTDETIKDFRIGFAPQSWDFLLKSLAQKEFRKEEAEKAGLAIKSEDNSSFYDRFRSRIMFPINDINGRVIGFGGRIFSQESETRKSGTASTEAKYVNTPNTLIYDKSRVLYGFDKARQDIRSKNQAVVVEGYMDCLMSHQAGVKNTIAVSGTALTSIQLQSLKRLCDTLLSSFDADSAGDSATKRSLALASQAGFVRKIVYISSGKDPADLVLENPDAWKNAVLQAQPVTDFYFAKAFRDYNPSTAEGKKMISLMLLPLFFEIADEIEKAHWVSELAKKLGIGEDAVWKELKRYGASGKIADGGFGAGKAEQDSSEARSRKDLLEERILALLAAVGGPKKGLKEVIFADNLTPFISAANQPLWSFLRNGEVGVAVTADLQNQLNMLKFKGEVLAQSTKDTEEELAICRREFEKECLKKELIRLGEEVKVQEKKGDEAGLKIVLANFDVVSGRLRELYP